MTTQTTTTWIGVSQALRILSTAGFHVSDRQVRRYCVKGNIRATQFNANGSWHIDRASLMHFIEIRTA